MKNNYPDVKKKKKKAWSIKTGRNNGKILSEYLGF